MAFNYLPRELHYGVKDGHDIFALHRALIKANCRKRYASHHFGRICRSNVKLFQSRHGLIVDGTVGPKTSLHLQPYYDAYGKLLIQQWVKNHPPKTMLTPQERITRAAYYALGRKAEIHYRESRPMTDMSPPPNVPNVMDCSTLTTWCYKVAGLPDPNGLNYNGSGYTGTQLVHGFLRFGPAHPGDLVFSYWPVSHVSVAVGGGMVISHGREGCPCLYPQFSVNQIRGYVN